MKLLLFFLFYCPCVYSQDTISVLFGYGDTSCKFSSETVQEIFNSGCLKERQGYVITYKGEEIYIWRNKDPIPGNIKVYYYKKQ